MRHLAGAFLCMILGTVAEAHSEPAARTFALHAEPCVGRTLDLDALAAALRIEIASTPDGGAVTTRSDREAAVTVQLGCTAQGGIDMEVRRLAPPGSYRGGVTLADVERAARPRTLALAIGEKLRDLDAAPAPPAPGPGPAVAPMPLLGWSAAESAKRRRLTGGLAIGLGALSFVGVVLGGSLIGAGQSGPGDPIPGLIAPGAALLSLGGSALIGGGVSLGLWLKERRRQPAL